MKTIAITALICVCAFAQQFREAIPHAKAPAREGWTMSGAFMKHSFNLQNSGGVPYFSFFDASTGQFDGYLLKPVIGPLSGTLFLAAQIVTTGSPVFMYNSEPSNTCVYPATVRPFIESGNNTLQKWWANSATVVSAWVLQSGSVMLAIPLSPEHWTSVYGENGADHPAEFAASLANPWQIGMAFGGGCFFGHGVNVSGGTATFYLNGYSIQ